MAKTVWHTDIVVGGQGMNLKLFERKPGKFRLVIHPDVPGGPSRKAVKRFREAVRKGAGEVETVTEAKRHVAQAIKKSRGRWNEWHREAYSST